MLARTTLLSISAVVIACMGIWIWMSKYEERPAVDILASREPQLGVPVYAQFVVTQSLRLDTIASVTRLVVPMFIPSNARDITIRLYRNRKLIREWQTPTDRAGVVEAEFVLDAPVLIDGDIEVQFDGGSISNEDVDSAPRVFVESSDINYPNGSYRIANNVKRGDVSLRLIERTTRWELFFERLYDEPFRQLAVAGSWLLFLMLFGSIPHIVSQQQGEGCNKCDTP